MHSIASLLQLECPLVVLDCEMTGIKPKHDRVVQIALVKIRPDGTQTEWATLVNPETPIPPEATAIHGISDEMVRDAPTFKSLAPKLHLGFQKCDFAGYNVHFDLDSLTYEFERAGMKSPFNGRVLDALNIFRDKHPRTLTDAVRVYLGETLGHAHNAIFDVRATLRVLEAQLLQHTDLPRDVGQLHRQYQEGLEGKLVMRFGKLCIAFGEKHVNAPLDEVAVRDPKFLKWILDRDFNRTIKRHVEEALEQEQAKKAKVRDKPEDLSTDKEDM